VTEILTKILGLTVSPSIFDIDILQLVHFPTQISTTTH